MPSSYSLGRKGAAQTGGRGTMELKLPSFKYDEDGNVTAEPNVCLVRVLDPVDMLAGGMLDDFDQLTSLAGLKMEEVDGKTRPTAESVQAFAGMTDQMIKGMDLVDRLCELVILEPAVVWPVHRYPAGHPEAGKPRKRDDGSWMRLGPDERDEGTLYTDDVDLDDRMFVLQWAVGGVKDPEQFRREYTGLLESVANVPRLPLSAFGDPAAK
jgi:hypothetical protein